jgi:hypothetical protein
MTGEGEQDLAGVLTETRIFTCQVIACVVPADVGQGSVGVQGEFHDEKPGDAAQVGVGEVGISEIGVVLQLHFFGVVRP